MATLQTIQHRSAFIAKSRLKQVVRDHADFSPPIPDAPFRTQNVVETQTAAPAYADASVTAQATLTKLQRRQLLLQTIIVYEQWQLASVHHRSQSDQLVAYLIRKKEQSDPNTAIREGRALQIVMDTFGNLTNQHPNQRLPLSLSQDGICSGPEGINVAGRETTMTSLFHNSPNSRLSSSTTKQTTSLGNSPRFAPPSSTDDQADEPYRTSYDDGGEPPFTQPRSGDAWQPFSENIIDTQPYEQTIILFHHNRRGVRVYIQARTKIFFALLGVLLVVLNLPGVSNLITALVKVVAGGN